jgi:hypothetical protein
MRENFVACDVLSQLQRVMDNERLANVLESLRAWLPSTIMPHAVAKRDGVCHLVRAY